MQVRRLRALPYSVAVPETKLLTCGSACRENSRDIFTKAA